MMESLTQVADYARERNFGGLLSNAPQLLINYEVRDGKDVLTLDKRWARDLCSAETFAR